MSSRCLRRCWWSCDERHDPRPAPEHHEHIGGQYVERWPEDEWRIILYTPVFTYQQRITALTFLYGNLRDADLVYNAVIPQLGVNPRDPVLWPSS